MKVRQFFDGGVKRELAVGEVLLFPDMEKPIPISYIVKGRVVQYSINDEGNRSIVNMFKSGAFFRCQSRLMMHRLIISLRLIRTLKFGR